MRKLKKKLDLELQTLRVLDGQVLDGVVGGGFNNTCCTKVLSGCKTIATQQAGC